MTKTYFLRSEFDFGKIFFSKGHPSSPSAGPQANPWHYGAQRSSSSVSYSLQSQGSGTLPQGNLQEVNLSFRARYYFASFEHVKFTRDIFVLHRSFFTFRFDFIQILNLTHRI